jgi:5-formyltetrahydrofolate cyclo-ligase
MSNIESAKVDCRARLRRELAAMTPRQRRAESVRICERIRMLREFERASALLLYRPLRNEVDITALWEEAASRRRLAYFPRVVEREQPLEFVHADGDTSWSRGALGIWEPRGDEPLTAEVAAGAVIVVPGLGFTREGYRLGRGAGYYDRTLMAPPISCNGYRIGVAFSRQLVDQLPTDRLDVRMHAVVTAENTWFAALPLPDAT